MSVEIVRSVSGPPEGPLSNAAVGGSKHWTVRPAGGYLGIRRFAALGVPQSAALIRSVDVFPSPEATRTAVGGSKYWADFSRLGGYQRRRWTIAAELSTWAVATRPTIALDANATESSWAVATQPIVRWNAPELEDSTTLIVLVSPTVAFSGNTAEWGVDTSPRVRFAIAAEASSLTIETRPTVLFLTRLGIGEGCITDDGYISPAGTGSNSIY